MRAAEARERLSLSRPSEDEIDDAIGEDLHDSLKAGQEYIESAKTHGERIVRQGEVVGKTLTSLFFADKSPLDFLGDDDE